MPPRGALPSLPENPVSIHRPLYQFRRPRKGVEARHPVAALERFDELRKVFFNFDPIVLALAAPGRAMVELNFCMRQVPEAAACFQAMGFFERFVELAGAGSTQARFKKRSWEGDQQTVLELAWGDQRK